MKALYDIVGMKYRGTEKFVRALPSGEVLDLLREPTNQHDPNAVQVWAHGQHVGYIKGTQAVDLARWMDSDAVRREYGTSGRLVAGSYPAVEINQ